MKTIKRVSAGILILFTGIVVFYFWGSSGRLNASEYNTVKHYTKTPKETGDTLTVMTYNLGYLSGMTNNRPLPRPESMFDENLANVQHLLNALSPDIIGFQEIDFGSNRSHGRQQLDSIAMAGNYHQGYQSINWDKKYVPFPYWPLNLHFGSMLSGQAILSHFPISHMETHVLEKPKNAPFYYNAFYLDRLLQIVQIPIGDRLLTVMNVHLEAFDTETREAQAPVVREMYEQYVKNGPVILMGDFNSQPPWESESDNVMKILFAGTNIASAVSEDTYKRSPSAYYTFDTKTPYQMIDYILYSPQEIQMIESWVVQEAGQASDHLPVMMKFVFRPQKDTVISE
jgi:endonuclease/exonuclease/phosphatase family metal-dependent hydrolase